MKNCSPKNRPIDANQIWLKISDLRPTWVPLSVPVYATPCLIEYLYGSLPPYHDNNDRLIAGFLENVIRVLEKNPSLGEVDEGSVEVCSVEMKVLDDAIDRWIGVRRNAASEVFICSEDDWIQNPHE